MGDEDREEGDRQGKDGMRHGHKVACILAEEERKGDSTASHTARSSGLEVDWGRTAVEWVQAHRATRI